MSLAGPHYEQALREYFEDSRHHPQYETWFRYAFETNARGRELVQRVGQVCAPIAGRRLLDVGSGYGGTCIAAALEGARETVGVELSPVQMRLARFNLQDHPELSVSLHACDVLDRAATAHLGTFDLLTCDNVLEHVASPAALLLRIRELLAPGGFAYITVPNAFSLAQVRCDCHYGLFGISLLDPPTAARYAREAAGIGNYDVSLYYRREVLGTLLEQVGLEGTLVNRTGHGASLDGVREQLAALRATPLDKVPDSLREHVAAVVKSHVDEVDACLTGVERATDHRLRDAATRSFVDTYLLERWELAVSVKTPVEALAANALERAANLAKRLADTRLGREARSLLQR